MKTYLEFKRAQHGLSQQIHKLLLVLIAILLAAVTYGQTDSPDVLLCRPNNIQREVDVSVSKVYQGNVVVSSFGHVNSLPSGATTSTGLNVYYIQTLNENGTYQWTERFVNYSSNSAGDPYTTVDANGNLYCMMMITGLKGTVLSKSSDKGQTWSIINQNVSNEDLITTDVFDKEVLSADDMPSSPYANYLYCAYRAINQGKTALAYSNDMGVTFNKKIIDNNDSWGPNVQTGELGEVYVAYTRTSEGSPCNVYFVKSTAYSSLAGGAEGLSSPQAIFSFTPYNTADIRLTSTVTVMHRFLQMAVDKSCKSTRGRIYITYLENVSGSAITKLRYSSDKGVTWSSPVTVSATGHTKTHMPAIAVDRANGAVSVIYYNATDVSNPASQPFDVYVAYSTDGAASFSQLKVNDVSSSHDGTPTPRLDYVGIDAHGGTVYPVWTDRRNGSWQLYCSPFTINNSALYSSDASLNIKGPLFISSATNTTEYKAATTIIAPQEANMVIQTNSIASMQAGQSITLDPGLFIDHGATFETTISTPTACINTYTRLASSDSVKSFEETEPKAHVYPNPSSSGDFNFKINPGLDDHFTLVVTDLSGKRVLEKKISPEDLTNTFQINLTNEAEGIYLYKMEGNKGTIYSGKLLKGLTKTADDEIKNNKAGKKNKKKVKK